MNTNRTHDDATIDRSADSATSGLATDAIVPGAIAGLAGGAVFGAAIIHLGMLDTIASLVRSSSSIVGFVVHLVVAVVVGIGFGLLIWFQRPGVGETLFWGLAYGAIWWFLGAVTLLPLLSGEPVAWDIAAARRLVPSLVGHLAYGGAAGLAYVAATRRRRDTEHRRPTRGALGRGAAAGLVGGLVLAAVLDGQPGRPSVSASMVVMDRPVAGAATALVGLLAGLAFASLYPAGIAGAGPALVRGMAFGFLMWLTIAITLVPLAAGNGLSWQVNDLRSGFETLPGYLLFVGAVPALLYTWFTVIARSLTSDRHAGGDQEGLGTQGLRVIIAGAAAGLVGGTVFSVVIVQVGDLPAIASMVGTDSSTVGFVLHLITSVLIGIGYGIAFVKRSNDLNSALGWGTSYGVFWWMMGSLTLLPVLAGGSPQWTVTAAADAFPALIGHLAYGAFLGVVFFALEARFDPWWVSRNDAEETRAQRAADQLAGSAPALWVLTVLFALIVPILLAP